MTTVTIGSGIGSYAGIAVQPTYGGMFATPTRTLTFKSGKATIDPKFVQGGPYLRGGQGIDIGSARILVAGSYPWAKGTLSGDMMNTGAALLAATAFGSAATLMQLASTTAYELGGSDGATIGFPDTNNGGDSGCCFDMQWGVPTTDGTVHPFSFHSCMITKATWVYDRTGFVTYEYEWDAQYVEETTDLYSQSQPTAPVPFSMGTSDSTFEVGDFGSEAALDGVRKVTYSIERKLSDARWYLGNNTKDLPVTNDNIKIGLSIDADYTTAAKTGLFDLFTAGTPTSVQAGAVGAAIGSSGHNDTFQIDISNAFADTGGEANPDGPDVVKNTIAWSGTLDSAADAAMSLVLITADSEW